MFRLTSIILLHGILIFQCGFGVSHDNDTMCDCQCNCDMKIEGANDELDTNVGMRENEIDTKISNFEKRLLTNLSTIPYSFMKTNSLKSGIYTIDLPKINVTDLEVFCEEDVDSGVWIIIQRRQSDSVNFNRNWHDYKAGFGDLTGNYWIGLETLHALTSDCEQELYIQMQALNGTKYYAKYSNMLIGNETEDYVLKLLGDYSGNAGDSLSYHLGMKFSTYDRDNDDSKRNCAYVYDGGWWFNNCYRGYLNGRIGHNLGGVNWHSIEIDKSLAFAQMMIRPNQICWRKLMWSIYKNSFKKT